jgi:hypothetical protein
LTLSIALNVENRLNRAKSPLLVSSRPQSTLWDKLIPKLNLGGGGGECPLLLIGIEADSITGVERATARMNALQEAEDFKQTWRDHRHKRWADAQPIYEQMKAPTPKL